MLVADHPRPYLHVPPVDAVASCNASLEKERSGRSPDCERSNPLFIKDAHAPSA